MLCTCVQIHMVHGPGSVGPVRCQTRPTLCRTHLCNIVNTIRWNQAPVRRCNCAQCIPYAKVCGMEGCVCQSPICWYVDTMMSAQSYMVPGFCIFQMCNARVSEQCMTPGEGGSVTFSFLQPPHAIRRAQGFECPDAGFLILPSPYQQSQPICPLLLPIQQHTGMAGLLVAT